MSRIAHVTLLLNAIGEHPGAAAATTRPPTGPADIISIARTAEAGILDAVFLADSPAAGGPGTDTAGSGASRREYGADREQRLPKLEPITLLTAIAAHTTRIGLVATASTSFYEPYNLARLFASLDLISAGRAGWNAVTTSHPRAAANFGNTFWADHAERYSVADEFLGVVELLWDTKRTPAAHNGRRFRVEGALDIPPSVQERPVISQAGGSPEGIELASRHAELVFAIQPNLEAAAGFASAVREAASRQGRDGDAIRILPGVVPYIRPTKDEAVAYKEYLDSLVDLDLLYPLASRFLHIDEVRLRDLRPSSPFPVDLLPDASTVANSVATYRHLVQRIVGERLTVAQAIIQSAGGRHREFVGTPEGFADEVELWLRNGAGDGYTLMPPVTATELPRFVSDVIPVLASRGLHRRSYASETLRGNLA